MGWESEIPDVVAGQPIESAWGNEVRDKLVHVVGTVAGLPTPVVDGAFAYVEDIDLLYVRRAGAWGPAVPRVYTDLRGSDSTAGAGQPLNCVTVNIPAGQRVGAQIHIAGILRYQKSVAAGTLTLELRVDASVVATFPLASLPVEAVDQSVSVIGMGTVLTTGATAVALYGTANAGSVVARANTRVTAIVYP